MQQINMFRYALLSDPQKGMKQWVLIHNIWSHPGEEIVLGSNGSREKMLLNILYGSGQATRTNN